MLLKDILVQHFFALLISSSDHKPTCHMEPLCILEILETAICLKEPVQGKAIAGSGNFLELALIWSRVC